METTRRGFLAAFSGFVLAPPRKEAAGQSHLELSAPSRDSTTPYSLFSHPSDDPAWLTAWLRLPRLPIMPDHLPHFAEFRRAEFELSCSILSHIQSGKPLTFTYHGGTEPETRRRVLPTFLYATPSNIAHPELSHEPLYLLAHCLTRKAPRTFRLDRITP